jgi:hypothetical protein
MIRIAITQAAFEAIARTLALGSVGYENQINERGERLIWLEPNVVHRLRASARSQSQRSACHARYSIALPASAVEAAPFFEPSSAACGGCLRPTWFARWRTVVCVISFSWRETPSSHPNANQGGRVARRGSA